MQGRRRQVCDSESRPRSESAPQGAHGPQPANRRGHQDQGQDGSSFARGEGVQRRHLEVVFAEEKLSGPKTAPESNRAASTDPGRVTREDSRAPGRGQLLVARWFPARATKSYFRALKKNEEARR